MVTIIMNLKKSSKTLKQCNISWGPNATKEWQGGSQCEIHYVLCNNIKDFIIGPKLNTHKNDECEV